ncbi:MAG: hypothetical protein CML56_00185 [Rhodobacteraceae bacterium]|nr:hypothetical protein [Paracoccaceae bacterium]
MLMMSANSRGLRIGFSWVISISMVVLLLGPVLSSDSVGSEDRSIPRNCQNVWSVGDTDNVTNSDGTFAVTVEKISANLAIFVENGEIVSSTTLNDISSNWESIIFSTVTNYFGDAPDVDSNCQIEVAIISIDGVGSTEGYFEPGISSVREVIFLDIDDLVNRNRILAHEFEQLIHYSSDPYEFIWIDEGSAELSEFLSYGSDPSLENIVNSWTTNSSTSLRWWDDRVSDLASSFLFMSYLEEKLGGADAMRRMIADPSSGGSGIENIARSPSPGSMPIGNTMSEIFANFSAAVTLDSPQGAFGFDEIELRDDCTDGGFCKVVASGENDQWSDAWQSSGHTIEGWGLKTFRFTEGNGDPLSIMVQPDRFGFEGSIISKDSSSGTWTMEKLRIDSDGRGTGLVRDFGNTTSEVWLLVWFNSIVDDCDFDFANCGVLSGGSYPTGSFTVSASLVTTPAQVSIESMADFDRDGDALSDSIEMGLTISSSAYFETLDLEISSFNNNTEIDSFDFVVSVGNTQPEIQSVWFTPPYTGDWEFSAKIRDISGEIQDIAQTLPVQIFNMKPVGSGSISSNSTETWLPTYIFGGGYDAWGFGIQNGTFGHNDTPNSYIWDLGDGNSSRLKNPVHSFSGEGLFFITLIISDQGGYFSESVSWNISVNDSSTPIPEISIDGLRIQDNLTIQTNQRIQFSSFGTTDNVPLEMLYFSWDWGDGSFDSGVGLSEIGHAWIDGTGEGTIYSMSLQVSDGKQSASEDIQVRVLNRVPSKIFDENLTGYAITPIRMPDVFEDDDGIIVEYRWNFPEGVNLDGGDVSMASDFTEKTSFESNPSVSWKEPGMKNVTIEVVDDDGNRSIAYLGVEILNQRPVALFERPVDGKIGDAYVFSSSSFDPDGDTSSLIHIWTFSDRDGTIENVSSVSRTFSKPGLYSISLEVVDERGLRSAPKVFLIFIDNPLPIPVITFSSPGDDGSIFDSIPDEGDESVIWKVPMTEDGGVFVAPGDMIRFDGSDSFDSDPEFEGMSSTDPNDSDWSGIVEWIWDFGDASPSTSGPYAWHNYERPGEYKVRLTIVDGFGEGDSNTTEILVIVSSAPIITTTNPISTEYVVVGESVNLSGLANDSDLGSGIIAWIDENSLIDSDGDGITTNDKDANLTGPLLYKWDINVFFDEDCRTDLGCDGNPRNDWITADQIWEEPGEVRISMTVCDGVGVCSSKDYVVTVLSIQDTAPPKTLSDLSIEDLMPGRESAGILSLVALVAILGWMVMRGRDDDELDAIDMVKKYDIEEVEDEGGLPGMDQHTPPPQPKYLTDDERTNSESGYVRPIRTRRR